MTFIECGIASRPMRGEVESGDLYTVKEFSKETLVAVMDGLGHGHEASLASKAAMAVIENFVKQLSITEVFQQCHRALKRTRGGALSAAIFDGANNTVTWAGVGNVEAVMISKKTMVDLSRETLLLHAGIVGHELPKLHASTLDISPGDLCIFATDGVKNQFLYESHYRGTPQQIADRLLSDHGKTTDDALVLVVRYLGFL